MLAKEVRVCLTGFFREDDIIEGIVEMARIKVFQPEPDARSNDISTISYLTEDTKQAYHPLRV